MILHCYKIINQVSIKLIFILEGQRKNKVWCQLAYWEECQRVGPLQQISIPYVQVLQSTKISEKNNSTLPTTSSTSPTSTSSNAVSKNTFSKPLSTTPLSKTCDQYSNLNIVDSEASTSCDKISKSNLNNIVSMSSMAGYRLSSSKYPASVIKEKKALANSLKEDTESKRRDDEGSNRLYLADMFPFNTNPSHSTDKTRQKIGKGTEGGMLKLLPCFLYSGA